jgi:phage-related protein
LTYTFVRQVLAYKRYFLDFFDAQGDDLQRKITWTLNLLRTLERVPRKYFEHIEGSSGLYEIRVEHKGCIFRIFAFFDKGNIVVLGNGFQKKTQKTPRNEIQRALKIKAEYENEKAG